MVPCMEKCTTAVVLRANGMGFINSQLINNVIESFDQILIKQFHLIFSGISPTETTDPN